MLHVFVCNHKISHLLQIFERDPELFKTDRQADLFIKGAEFLEFLIVLVYQKLQQDPDTVKAFLRAIYKAQQWCVTASDEEIAQAMQPSFPDTSLESLKIVAHSYRETDSWKQELVMEEGDYGRLLDVIDTAGELTARPPFADVVDNSLAEAVQKGK